MVLTFIKAKSGGIHFQNSLADPSSAMVPYVHCGESIPTHVYWTPPETPPKENP